jgi:hypothetical protein
MRTLSRTIEQRDSTALGVLAAATCPAAAPAPHVAMRRQTAGPHKGQRDVGPTQHQQDVHPASRTLTLSPISTSRMCIHPVYMKSVQDATTSSSLRNDDACKLVLGELLPVRTREVATPRLTSSFPWWIGHHSRFARSAHAGAQHVQDCSAGASPFGGSLLAIEDYVWPRQFASAGW